MKIAMVTSWGTVCGIAQYTDYFMDAVVRLDPEVDFMVLAPHPSNMHDSHRDTRRCWRQKEESPEELLRQISSSCPDLVHIQYSHAFFTEAGLGLLVKSIRDMGIPVVVTFHSTTPVQGVSLGSVCSDLERASALVVHSPVDVERLRSWGLSGNVSVIPLATTDKPDEAAAEVREAIGLAAHTPVIASFGFLQPHKGVLETIDATARLLREYPQILYMAVSTTQANVESRMYLTECRARISRLGLQGHAVILDTFLPVEEVYTALHAADVIVMPYRDTGESASGAIRFALSSRRPVITSRQQIFADVRDATYQIKAVRPRDIAQGIKKVLESHDLQARLLAAENEYIARTSWKAVAEQYRRILHELIA
ncbi:MAG: glycosyltransferase [Coriobacteriia bacterium]